MPGLPASHFWEGVYRPNFKLLFLEDRSGENTWPVATDVGLTRPQVS